MGLICFGFCIWFCWWVFGAWKNKKVRLVLEGKRSKTKSVCRTQFLFDKTQVRLTRVRCLCGPSVHLSWKSSKLYSIYNSEIKSFGLELLDTQIVFKTMLTNKIVWLLMLFSKKIWHFQLNFATSRNGRIGPKINSLFFFGGKIGIFFSFKKEIKKKTWTSHEGRGGRNTIRLSTFGR